MEAQYLVSKTLFQLNYRVEWSELKKIKGNDDDVTVQKEMAYSLPGKTVSLIVINTGFTYGLNM